MAMKLPAQMDSKHIHKGRILHLQRLSTEDGPGIRTTIFFKGCPLHCDWCHNPESISTLPQIAWNETKCIGDQACVAACPNKALCFTQQGISVDREKCTGCGICADECPTNAIEQLGKIVTVEELTYELLKDKSYYDRSDGGVTASGGEPTLQLAFLTELFRSLKKHGIHTTLDTCGFCSAQTLNEILPYTDLILYDIKLFDPEKHRTYTGQTNEHIFENLLLLKKEFLHSSLPHKLWIRTPLIPEASATKENLISIGNFIAENLADVVSRWELCAFNNLCRDKYRRLNMLWLYENTELFTSAQIIQLREFALLSGIQPDLVRITGPQSP